MNFNDIKNTKTYTRLRACLDPLNAKECVIRQIKKISPDILYRLDTSVLIVYYRYYNSHYTCNKMFWTKSE